MMTVHYSLRNVVLQPSFPVKEEYVYAAGERKVITVIDLSGESRQTARAVLWLSGRRLHAGIEIFPEVGSKQYVFVTSVYEIQPLQWYRYFRVFDLVTKLDVQRTPEIFIRAINAKGNQTADVLCQHAAELGISDPAKIVQVMDVLPPDPVSLLAFLEANHANGFRTNWIREGVTDEIARERILHGDVAQFGVEDPETMKARSIREDAILDPLMPHFQQFVSEYPQYKDEVSNCLYHLGKKAVQLHAEGMPPSVLFLATILSVCVYPLNPELVDISLHWNFAGWWEKRRIIRHINNCIRPYAAFATKRLGGSQWSIIPVARKLVFHK